jgi:hypothetical protein
MCHVSIFETVHKVLHTLHMILLPFEDASTQVELLAIEVAQRLAQQSILKTFCRSSNAKEENKW